MKAIRLLSAWAAILFLPLCSWSGQPADGQVLKPVTLVCHWQPQAQFAGFYVAREKGFYRRFGLDVKILHSETTATNRTMLDNNKAQFITMFLATAIRYHNPAQKNVNIAQFVRRSSMIIAAAKNRGIKNVNDLNGRRVAIWYSDFEDVPLKFMAANRIKCQVEIISGGVNMFLYGGVDAITVTSYNELHSLMMAGMSPEELTLFKMNEFGLDIPEDGVYCREEYFNANKQQCLDFARATLEGWKYAELHQEEALGIVERELIENHLPMAKIHQKWMLEKILALIFPNGSATADTVLTREGYYRTADLLMSAGKIAAYPRYDDFCRGSK